MSTDTTPRAGRGGWLLALTLTAAAAAYAGMRCHTTLERWLVPSAAAAEAPPSAAAAAQLWTCGMHPQVIQDHPGDCPICHMKLTPLVGAGPGGRGSSGGVTIDPAVVQNMGVRFADVVEGPLAEAVRASASVVEPETGRRDINLRVSGWIETLHAGTEGQEVHVGDPLFDLFSPDLRLAIEELISARRAGGSLGESGAALATAAGARLVALGLSPGQVESLGAMEHAPAVVTFLSPIDGHVTDKAEVYAGSAVSAGQRVLRLSQRAELWVEARVHEQDATAVHVGQAARVRLDAMPGPAVEGRVAFIHPHLDPMTRTALVRVAVSNPHGLMREGMYATVEIDVGGPERVLLVPREAVLDTGETQLVMVSPEKGRFEPRRVVLGRSGSSGLVQVVSGLKAGEKVVASGQFLLDSESRLREAVSKFLGQKPEPAAGPRLALPAGPVSAVVAAYLPLAEALGAEQASDSPVQVAGLSGALAALAGAAEGGEARAAVARASSAAAAMAGAGLDRQRELFKELSAAVIVLAEASPPPGPLYVVNCPMAKADWLQRTPEVANPYYAKDMKACGSVVRPVGGER